MTNEFGTIPGSKIEGEYWCQPDSTWLPTWLNLALNLVPTWLNLTTPGPSRLTWVTWLLALNLAQPGPINLTSTWLDLVPPGGQG